MIKCFLKNMIVISIFLVIYPLSAYADDTPSTGFEDRNGSSWTTHEEELEFLEELAENSDRVRYNEIGRSHEDRPLHLVRVGYPEVPSDEDIANGRKVLIMGTPHGNEPAGREMALQLMRNLAYTEDPEVIQQLQDATILFIPSQNPDGSVKNQRFTNGVDLNQDRINLRTPEGQAIAAVIKDFNPDIIVSSHEKINSSPNISMLWPTNLNVDEDLRELNIEMVEEYIRPNVEAADYTTGIYGGIGSEWNLRNMGGLQHTLTVLYETGRDLNPLDRVDMQIKSSEAVLQFYRENFERVIAAVDEAPVRKADHGSNQSHPYYLDGDNTADSVVLDPPPCGYMINSQQLEKVESKFDIFSIEYETMNENKIFISMAQPMMTLVPLLLDDRANNHEVAGLPVFDCSNLESIDPPELSEPKQYQTDFSKYAVEQVPEDWTQMWMDSSWEIRDNPRRLEHISIGNQGSRRGLTWDEPGTIYGNVEISAVVRVRDGGLSKFQIGLHMSGTDIGRTQNTYYLDVYGSSASHSIRINRYKNGSYLMLRSARLPFGIEDNEWYQVVLQREGDTLRAKAWPFGDTEPDSWQVSVENPFIQQGKVGFVHLTDGVENDFAFFGVGTAGMEAPRAPEDLFDEKPEVNKDALQELVEVIDDENLNPSDYTEESWLALTEALADAASVLDNENATQEEVNEALEVLTTAFEGLVPNQEPDVDKAMLQEKVEEANALNEADYTEGSWAVLAEALEAAEGVLSDENVTQEEVNEALETLIAAIAGLEEKEEPVDKAVLQAKVEEVKAINEADYTEASWAVLAEALEAAASVFDDENATQEEVNEALVTLTTAIAELEEKEESVDKAALQAKVEEAEVLDEADYTAESWKPFGAALDAAIAVLVDEAAEQEEVDHALAALIDAHNGLKAVEEPTDPEDLVDKSALQEKVNKAKEFNVSDYTKESWSTLGKALEAAEDVLVDENASQAAVDQAIAALTEAIKGLKEKSSKPDDKDPSKDKSPGKDKMPGKDKTPGKDDGTGKQPGTPDKSGLKDGSKLPSTATSYYNWILIGFVLVLLAGVLWKINRKRQINN